MKRSHRHLLLLALLAAPGCDSSKGEKVDVGLLEKRLQAAETAMEEAKKAGADKSAADDFSSYKQRLEDAKALIEEGKTEKVGSKLASAERGFKDLSARAQEARKAQAGALEAKKAADKAIADARKAKVDVACPDAFAQIKELMDSAELDLNSGNPQKIAGALRAYTRVQELVKEARAEALEKKKWMVKADSQKKAALEKEGQAKQAKAEQLVLDEFSRAQAKVREADVEYQSGNFQAAFDAYTAAENIFVEAINRAREAELLEQGSPPPAVPPAVDVKIAVARGSAPPPAPPAGGNEGKTPRPGAEAVPPGELNPEDEVFLADNLSKITKGVQPEYNPATGDLSVEYDYGDLLKKDVIYPRGPVPEKNILWKDPMGGVNSKQAKGQKELGLAFQGNTRGFFLIPIPFKGTVEMEYLIEIGLMTSDGAVTPILMASEDGKSYYGANFGTIEAWSGGGAKPTARRLPNDPKLQRSANYWFSKTELGGVSMKVRYEPGKDEKKGKVTLWYDTNNRDDPINVWDGVPSKSGFVGFSWFSTKFNVRQLKISGKLDKQAAVKVLRAKLGKDAGDAGGGSPSAGAAPPAEGAKGGAGSTPARPAEGARSPKSGTKKAGDGQDAADY